MSINAIIMDNFVHEETILSRIYRFVVGSAGTHVFARFMAMQLPHGLHNATREGHSAMKIKLPVMCGLQSHGFLQRKVDKALTATPPVIVELDCTDTVFTTGGFCRFISGLYKRVKGKGKIRLTNVRPALYDCIRVASLDQLVDVERIKDV